MRKTGARCCGPVGAAVAGTRLYYIWRGLQLHVQIVLYVDTLKEKESVILIGTAKVTCSGALLSAVALCFFV